MSIILFFLLLLAIASFIIYLIVKKLDKRQLKKLRRNYNADEDNSKKPEQFVSRNPDYSGVNTRAADSVVRAEQEFGKPDRTYEGNEESGRQRLFQNEPAVNFGEDKQQPERTAKNKRIIGRLRRRRRNT